VGLRNSSLLALLVCSLEQRCTARMQSERHIILISYRGFDPRRARYQRSPQCVGAFLVWPQFSSSQEFAPKLKYPQNIRILT
jgi:hypothetical protein